MTKKRSRIIAAFILTVLLVAGFCFSGAARPQQKTNLTVSAAISLKDALDRAEQAYTAINANVTFSPNYGGSGTLQQQIEQGAPVDVFISAAPKQMDALQSKGLLLDGTRRDLFANEVVLIVPKNSKLGLKSFRDLTRPDVKKIALGEPTTVPAGQYAKEVLSKLGIESSVTSKAVLAKDVRQVLTYVETGNVDAGIVYTTDAEIASDQVTIVARAPEGSHEPVIYPVAVIKDSKNPDAAKKFLDFLASPQGSAIFESYGFGKASS
jgi:molybdate transport system substrate-binding protein